MSRLGGDEGSFSLCAGYPKQCLSLCFPRGAWDQTCILASSHLQQLMILYVVIRSLLSPFLAKQEHFAFFFHETAPCFQCPPLPQGLGFPSFHPSFPISLLWEGNERRWIQHLKQVCADRLDNNIIVFSLLFSDLLFSHSIILLLLCFQQRFAWGGWCDSWSYRLMFS